MMKHTAYLALGSNIGQREENLNNALQLISKQPMIEICKLSSIYETEPVGYTEQPHFLNMVIRIETDLKPQELINVTKQVEVDCGRIRDIRWGPRTLDLDILLFDRDNIETEHLIVPHPRMMERSFVMVPLLEVVDKETEDWLCNFEINTALDGMKVWHP